MPKNFLGRDGLASDETVVEYYASGPYVTRLCWGKRSITTPEKAIAELKQSIANTRDPEIDPSGIEARRLIEMSLAVMTIRDRYHIEGETK
jgi:hypothetical protein